MSLVKVLPNKFRLVLLASFLGGFAPIAALYGILFETSLGFDVQTISLLFAFWAAAYVLFEVPTGVLADYFSRSATIGIGFLLRGIGFGLWAIWPNVWGVAIGFALWAFSIACWSGAEEALLHDELESIGKESLYPKLSGFKESIFLSGCVAGYLTASLIQHKGFVFLCVVSAVSTAAAGVVYLFFTETARAKHETYLGTLQASVRTFIGSKKLIAYGVLLIIVHQIVGVLEEYQSRVFGSMGASLSTVAIVVAITNVLSAVALTKTDRLSKLRMGQTVALGFILCVIYALGLFVSGAGGMAAIVIFCSGFIVLRMLFLQSMTRSATSMEKATIGSIPGFIGGVVGVVMFAVVGFASGRYGQFISLGVYAVSLGLIMSGYYIAVRRRFSH